MINRLKVCIITHSYPRFEGDWRSNFIESLARAYAENAADVTVFVPYAVRFNRKLVDSHEIRIVSYKYMPFASLHTVGYGHSLKADLNFNLQDLLLMPFLLLSGLIRFSLLLRKEDFDLVHAHWAVPSALIAVLGRFFAGSRAKIFTSFPGSDVTVITKLGRLGRIAAKIIGRSDYLSCNSSDLKEDLVKAGMDKNRIDTVIYGVDDKKIFFSVTERAVLRQALGVSDTDVVLLMIGRFVPKKGFATAFRSLKYVTRSAKNVRMVVVGDGPLKDEYLDILREDHTESCVTFMGEIPLHELGKYYSACDIFLMPSRRLPSDGLNVVVPEAMACGRPVVASDVGGNDLVIFHGVNGYLHRENDSKQLAEFVVDLMEHPETAREMGRNSLKLTKERFNWDAIAKYYLERYRERVPIHNG
jgi:glycosyltransferase involved in cell wall biosynthesis